MAHEMSTLATTMALFSVALSVLLVFVLAAIHSWIRSTRLKKHMFPSPPGIPFIGNTLQVPHTEAWFTFTRWKKQYGPIFSLNLAGKHVVVLNTLKSSTDLLDRRSSIYSDRPRMIVAGEILCGGLNVTLMRYGDLWRKMRRVMHDSLHIHHVHVYQARQESNAAILIARLLTDPEGWHHCLKQAGASIALSVTYDQQLTGKNSDSIVQRIDDIACQITAAASPAGGAWVELFPIFSHLPGWLATWKRIGRERYTASVTTFKDLLDSVQERSQVESVGECLAMSLIEEKGKYGLEDEQSSWLAGMVFGAGSGTTADAMIVFMLAMVLYPKVLKCAQEEIDDVVGRKRMPNYEDQSSLPYVDAILKEVLRWRPVTPLGLARRCIQDDWYDGHFIPAGATVIANFWAMSRDTEYFPDPDEFVPERYLGNDAHHGSIKPEIAFGFGRRKCPGRHFAYQNLYVLIASMIWAFDITKARDANGQEVTPSRTACVDEGASVHPALFPCKISPRHAGIEEVVKKASA